MAPRPKTYRQFAWSAFSAHLVLIAAAALLLLQFRPATTFPTALLFAFAAYFAWAIAAKSMFIPAHSRAMKLFRQGNYPAAIAAFEASDRHLAANPWIDNHRWIVLLNASAVGYREIAWFNIGKAYTFMGQAAPARRAFSKFLEVAPRSTLAPTVRVILSTLEKKKK